jgi:sugar/nucleoside kinase (ribokinase family)
MRRMLGAGPGLVALTLGARGAAYAMRGDAPAAASAWDAWRLERSAMPLREGIVPPGAPSATGDPTGCGDVWGATLISSLVAGVALEDAIARAHAAAARKLHHRGASDLYPVLAGLR